MASSAESPYWNLIQTLGWLFLRDDEFIGAAADGAHEERLVVTPMRTPDGEIRRVEQPDRPLGPLAILVYAEDSGTRHFVSLEDAEAALIQVLANGGTEALGLENGIGDLKPVPAAFWIDAKFYFEPDMAAPKQFLRIGATRWLQLRFRADHIRRLWPAVASASTPVADPPPDRLSFRQIAARWLAERRNAGIAADEFAVDLVAVAESGAFTSRPEPDAPRSSAFDPRLGLDIHTFGPDGQPTAPDEIRRFVLGDSGAELFGRRLIAARDLSVSLTMLAEWLVAEDGERWLAVRGLKLPKFLLAWLTAGGVPVSPTAKGERDCYDWLLGLMRAGDQEEEKSVYKVEALSRFRVSERGFNRAWANARAEARNPSWGKAGRKSSQVNRIAK